MIPISSRWVDKEIERAAALRLRMLEIVRLLRAKYVFVPPEHRFLARAVFGSEDSPRDLAWMIVHGDDLAETRKDYPIAKEHAILAKIGHLPPISMQPGTWAFLSEDGCLYIRTLSEEPAVS